MRLVRSPASSQAMVIWPAGAIRCLREPLCLPLSCFICFSFYRNFLFIFPGEGPVVKARILTCVEGMNVPLLEQAIQEQRKYFSERQEQMGNSTS